MGVFSKSNYIENTLILVVIINFDKFNPYHQGIQLKNPKIQIQNDMYRPDIPESFFILYFHFQFYPTVSRITIVAPGAGCSMGFTVTFSSPHNPWKMRRRN